MLHPNVPESAELVKGKDDAGKRVIVNSSGGALVNVAGTVLVGPFTYQYLHKYKVKPKNDAKDRYGREQVKYKEEMKESTVQWLVLLDNYSRDFTFIESELTFNR